MGWVGREIFEDFVVVVVIIFFYVRFLALNLSFNTKNCKGMFWKKGVSKFFKI